MEIWVSKKPVTSGDDDKYGASGKELPCGNGHSLPRNEGRVVGELRVVGLPAFTVITVPVKFSCGTVTATKPFSHRGRAVTRKEWKMVREKKSNHEA